MDDRLRMRHMLRDAARYIDTNENYHKAKPMYDRLVDAAEGNLTGTFVEGDILSALLVDTDDQTDLAYRLLMTIDDEALKRLAYAGMSLGCMIEEEKQRRERVAVAGMTIEQRIHHMLGG